MITQRQADLLGVGDEVEVSFDGVHGTRHTVRGKVHAGVTNGVLYVGGVLLRTYNGKPDPDRNLDLRVISRALPPLYANHDREEPAQGDVVRRSGPQPDNADLTWYFDGEIWRSLNRPGHCNATVGGVPRGFTLLVDGTTGRTVP